MMKKMISGLFLSLLLVSCTAKFMVISDPLSMPSPRVLKTPPRVALVLGGGAFHGIAHLGVIKVLEDAKVPIDLIVGASAGSLVGCLYADNPHADFLHRLINSTKASNVFDFSLFRSREGFVSGKKLQAFIQQNCSTKLIENLRIPFVAVATDLINGKSIPLSSGPVAPSVNASCAIPMVFEPVKMYGLTLVDGGILDNIPADIARSYGSTVVIAVDVMANFDTTTDLDSFTKVGIRSLMLMTGRLKDYQTSFADIVITPSLSKVPYMSGKQNFEAYMAGMNAAKSMLPKIAEILREKQIVSAP